MLASIWCNLGASQPLLSSQVGNSNVSGPHRAEEVQASSFCLQADPSRFPRCEEGFSEHLRESVALALLLSLLMRWISCTGMWHERIHLLTLYPFAHCISVVVSLTVAKQWTVKSNAEHRKEGESGTWNWFPGASTICCSGESPQ